MESEAQNMEGLEDLDQRIFRLFKDEFAALEPPASGWDGLKNRVLTAAGSQPEQLSAEIVCDLPTKNA